MITYLLVVIAFGILWCAIGLTYFITQNQELARVLEVQLKGLGETHMLGFEAVTTQLDRLEKRLKAVEEEVL